MKPIIGITMGDPAGIGSEIIAKVLNNPDIYHKCSPLVIGDKTAMKDGVRVAGVNLVVSAIKNINQGKFKHGVIVVYDLDNFHLEKIPYGRVNANCGRAAGEFIEKAIEMAMEKKITAIVTAPINKESFDLGGYGKKYRGHTEMLAALTQTGNSFMLLASGNLRVIHVTTHVSMREAVDLIKTDLIYNTIKKAYQACQELGIPAPKIGVAALNAHGGEGGIMGYEELNEIMPAIKQAKSEGLEVEGPIPGDTIFPRATAGTYDIIVAMYHDQGHIPVKYEGFNWNGHSWTSVSGVNITIGLPIIRTSVDHGTAFGKAGKGQADASSLFEAIDYAILIAKNRKIT